MPVTDPQTPQAETFAPTSAGLTQPQGQAPTGDTHTETPAAVTPELVRQIARAEAANIANAQVQKGEARITKKIQEQISALQQTAQVIGLTTEQVENAKQRIISGAYEPEKVTETQVNVPQQGAQPMDQAVQYMNEQLSQVFKEAGQAITRADPEYPALQQAIDANFYDPQGLVRIIRAADKAAQLKAARVSTNSEFSQARVLGSGDTSSSGASEARTAGDYWKNAYKK